MQLDELRKPPVTIGDPTGSGTIDGTNPLVGILGSLLGEPPAAQKERIEEATKDANDLTNLVKRKKTPASGSSAIPNEDGARRNGKRKADVLEESLEEKNGRAPKR